MRSASLSGRRPAPALALSLALLPAVAALAQTAPVAAPGGFVPQQAVSYGTAGQAATAVDATHPLPVAPTATPVSYTDRSGTIAAGGSAQSLAAANAVRRGFFVQNLSTGDLWINTPAAAVAGQPAIRIAAGQLYEPPAGGVPAGALSIIGATTGQAFSAREW